MSTWTCYPFDKRPEQDTCSVLAICPGCPTHFIPARRNQRYCTRQCQNKSYMQALRDEERNWAQAGDPPLTIVSTCSARKDGLGWAEIDLPFVSETARSVTLQLPSGDTIEVGRPQLERGRLIAYSEVTVDHAHYRVTISLL